MLRRRGAPSEREERVPIDSASPPATDSSCAPGSASPPTASSMRGEAGVDESMLTGEPAPVDVAPGTSVTAATIVHGGQPRRARPSASAPTRGSRRSPPRRGRPARQVACPAPRRPHLGGVRADRHRARRGDRDRLGRSRAAPSSRPSPRRSRCSSSPAPARSASPRRWRSSSARAGAPNAASSSPGPRRSTAPPASTRSCSTRPARSPRGRMRLTGVTPADGPSARCRPYPDAAAAAPPSSPSPPPSSAAPSTRSRAPSSTGRMPRAPRASTCRTSAARIGLGVSGVIAGDAAAAGRPAFLAGLGFAMPESLARRAAESDATLVAVALAGRGAGAPRGRRRGARRCGRGRGPPATTGPAPGDRVRRCERPAERVAARGRRRRGARGRRAPRTSSRSFGDSRPTGAGSRWSATA